MLVRLNRNHCRKVCNSDQLWTNLACPSQYQVWKVLIKVQKTLFACLSLITHSTCQCCVEDGEIFQRFLENSFCAGMFETIVLDCLWINGGKKSTLKIKHVLENRIEVIFVKSWGKKTVVWKAPAFQHLKKYFVIVFHNVHLCNLVIHHINWRSSFLITFDCSQQVSKSSKAEAT